MSNEPRPNRWTIAEARKNLPRVVDSSAREPQAIYRRRTLVAAVVDPATLDELDRHRARGGQSLGERFAELREIAAQTQYELPQPPRRDRPNALLKRPVPGSSARRRRASAR